jgi:D-amino-acid dehydrogenase
VPFIPRIADIPISAARFEDFMARTDAIVLGAGMVGVSAALHLAKRGLAVALVDRRGPGEETSYGNAGIIEGNTYFPYPFPLKISALLKIAFKQAPEANYHLSHLPRLAPWLFAYLRHSTGEAMLEFATRMRPLFAASIAEHEKLMRESGSERYLRTNGWLKIYRTTRAFDESKADLDAIAAAGLAFEPLDLNGSLALEPGLSPIFERGIFWPQAASVSNPLAVTRAYADLFRSLGGVSLTGDARSLHRADGRWRVDTSEGPVDAPDAVVALGPWAQDVLDPLGLKLPLEVKRGYHRHFRPDGNKGLNRPVLDAEVGYAVVPMEQGLRLTTGAEFADRDAPPTPVQFDRLMPRARALFPLGEPVEAEPWMGRRPCFPDSMPVIGRAPGQQDLWLDYGHAHWGLTLGPVSGRLLAEMMTGETPFTDPTPYRAERFLS